MELINTIDNCREFVVFNDTVAFIDNDYNFIIENRIRLKGKFTIGGSYGNKVILFDTDNFKSLIYDFDSKLIKVVDEFAIIQRSEVINGEFFAGTNDGKTIAYILCEADSFDIKQYLGDLNGLKGPYVAIENRYYISRDKKQIGLFDFNNQSIWLKSFSDFTSSESNFIGVRMISLNDRLFFQVSSEEKKGLFCINIMTGDLLNFYPEVSGGFLVNDKKFIYSIKYPNIICVINPLNGECMEWDANDLIKENGFYSVSDHRCTAHEGLIYITQTLGEIYAKTGIFDPFKKKLLAKYDFKPENGGIGSIKVEGDKVYIQTQDLKLHVFEQG
jgi:hypothetical protein